VLSSPRNGRIATVALMLCVLAIVPACWLKLYSAREKAREAACLSNVYGIGLACGTYANLHNGRPPHDFSDLKDAIVSTDWFICPSARDRTHCSYEFTGATNVWGVSSNVVILREILPNHHGKRVVLYDDGHVELAPYTH